jgi:hypothetical protein
MAAARGNKVPAIIVEHSENLADFHTITLSEQFEISNTGGITFEISRGYQPSAALTCYAKPKIHAF